MKKNKNLIKTTFIILLTIYVALFIAGKTGYYEKNIHDVTISTQEDIENFEEDIKNGEVLSISSYVEKTPDYSNTLTKAEVALANKIGDIINGKKDSVWDLIKSLFLG